MAVAHLALEGLIHDLNNIFQTIGEGADLLESDPKWKNLAATLQRSVERGQRIARGILDSSDAAPELAPVVERAIQFARDYLEGIHGPKLAFESRIAPGMRVKGEAAQWDSPWVLVNRLDTQRRRDSLRGRFVAAPSSDPTLAVRGGELRDSGGGRAIDRHGDVGRRLEPKDARGRVNTPSRRAAPQEAR